MLKNSSRRLILLPLLLLFTAGLAFGQGKSFEVATVRPAPPLNPAAIAAGGKLHIGMQVDKARVDIGLPLAGIIAQAFKAKSYQLQLPDWLSKEAQMYDILATLPEGATADDVPEMLQNLLKERFGMQYHKETKVRDVYALIQGKGAVKFQAVEISPEPEAGAAPKGTQAIQTLSGAANIQQNSNGVTVTSRGGAATPGIGAVKQTITPDGRIRAEMESTMAAFADQISQFVDKPVVDQTELNGVYQLSLDLSMADVIAVARARGMNVPAVNLPGAAPPGAASDPGGSSIFDSVQKLGLKLEARKMPLEVIVIDKLEKTPTEN
jgi:uncharacterized protein (TIGR03435 family)